MPRPLIILDRDGVINHSARRYVCAPRQWRALPRSLHAIARLGRADYSVAVATNQAGIAKGLYSVNTLHQIHQKMADELRAAGGRLSAILFCPHADADACACRKPKPGLFFELAERLQCDLRAAYAVGDSMRDLRAARAAGAKPVLVTTGHGAVTAAQLPRAKLGAVPIYKDLAEFADALLAGEL